MKLLDLVLNPQQKVEIRTRNHPERPITSHSHNILLIIAIEGIKKLVAIRINMLGFILFAEASG